MPSGVGSPRSLALRQCQGFRRVLLPEGAVSWGRPRRLPRPLPRVPSPSPAQECPTARPSLRPRRCRRARRRYRCRRGRRPGRSRCGAGGSRWWGRPASSGLAGDGEQAVDHEGHHHAAHVAQELGHRQHAAGCVRTPHHRVLAEGFQHRAGGADAGGNERLPLRSTRKARQGQGENFLLTGQKFPGPLAPPAGKPKEVRDDG